MSDINCWQTASYCGQFFQIGAEKDSDILTTMAGVVTKRRSGAHRSHGKWSSLDRRRVNWEIRAQGSRSGRHIYSEGTWRATEKVDPARKCGKWALSDRQGPEMHTTQSLSAKNAWLDLYCTQNLVTGKQLRAHTQQLSELPVLPPQSKRARTGIRQQRKLTLPIRMSPDQSCNVGDQAIETRSRIEEPPEIGYGDKES
ncbi:hypothetical protein BDY21DRAFT_182941 [Lineolata rhizophorae]|uniref:Uncharacterized protein n=1 Tax=Lineolata rhizophorae TaxID=578093 RepID=A0A6A6P802_9PEZI|nr:hypothetical protein BDY21DRAFT_182941 [Lineolata rhizophorae]